MGTGELVAHAHPDKLHTVGRPITGHEMHVIGKDGRVLGPGEVGEVVGRSASMMNGYHNRPDEAAEAESFGEQGRWFIRTGAVASVDEDGSYTLIGCRKNMIISGGINIYPVDLESVLLAHPFVAESP